MKRVLLPLVVSAGRTSCATAPARPTAVGTESVQCVAYGVIRQS